MVSDTYIYNEPESGERKVYIDQNGKPHLSRDAAVLANIVEDLERELRVQLCRAWPDDHAEREFMSRMLSAELRRDRSKLGAIVRSLIIENAL